MSLSEEHRQMFENRMPRKIFVLKGNDVRGC
jgi:hypothetical protein